MAISSKITSIVKDKESYVAYVQFWSSISEELPAILVAKTSCTYNPADETEFNNHINSILDSLVQKQDEIENIKQLATTALTNLINVKSQLVVDEKLGVK